MHDQAIEALLEQAAQRGAKLALESIGLHDANAMRDVRDLRDLIDAWRTLRGSALRTFGKVLALAILGLLALFFGKHLPWGN